MKISSTINSFFDTNNSNLRKRKLQAQATLMNNVRWPLSNFKLLFSFLGAFLGPHLSIFLSPVHLRSTAKLSTREIVKADRFVVCYLKEEQVNK